MPTAVATCGTAFGDDHARVLRRFLHDHEEFRGEVIFTFDGDAAGQKAALRAFGGDQNFVSQTYVAVEPTGLDPCDLRLQQGDAAVRELIARRRPLYRFVLDNIVSKYDLDRADGRVDATREAARLVSSIRDRSKVEAFAREIASMVGVDVEQARAEVRRAASRPAHAVHHACARRRGRGAAATRRSSSCPDLRDPRFALERETLKLVVQEPSAVASITKDVGENDFTHPTYRAVWTLVEQAGGIVSAGARLGGTAPRPRVRPGRDRRALGAGRRAAALEEGRRRGVRRQHHLPPPGADRPASHRRGEVAAPAHQPGRATRPSTTGCSASSPPSSSTVASCAISPWATREVGTPRTRPPVEVGAGERLLAWAPVADGGWAAGTRDALYLPEARVPWEQVQAADWDSDEGRLQVSEVGTWGEPRPSHELTIPDAAAKDADRLLQLVRERVTASVLLSRGTCRSPGAAAYAWSPAGLRRDGPRSSGSTSTTRASTPTIRSSARPPRPL